MNSQRNVGIVAFGFGEPANLIPNHAIAAAVGHLARTTVASVVFTDRDVAPHLNPYAVTINEISAVRVPTTYRLALLAAKGAKKEGFTELYVVAAPCHIWRCLRDLRWAAKDCGVSLTLTSRPMQGRQYDPAATTTFTRSALQWWPFETAYRLVSTLFPGWYKRTRA